jgi:quinoprotein relay system zinc metallohydrolase 1
MKAWLLALWLAAAGAHAADMAQLDYQLRARELAGGVWVVEGANADFAPGNGCNIINTGFIATGAGVLVVNTGPSKRYGEQLRALIERTTREPILQVIHLNLHPDYFLGNQAFTDVPRLATDATRAGMAREAKAYEDNLYRLCGEWMKGTEALLPSGSATLGPLRLGQRELEVDKASGVVFAGGLVFAQRVPTTPHAQIDAWLASLDNFAGLETKQLVPSHGPVRADPSAVEQTRRYLRWLDAHLRRAAEQGLEINELLRAEVPAEFRAWAAFASEYTRNVVHLYPRYEQAVLRPGR